MNRQQRRKLERNVAKKVKDNIKKEPVSQVNPVLNLGVNKNLRTYSPNVFSDLPTSLPKITYSDSNLTKHQQLKLSNDMFVVMLGLPVKVCKEKLSFTDSQCTDVCNEIMDAFEGLEQDYYTFDDVEDMLSDEANLIIQNVSKEMQLSQTDYRDQTFVIVISIAVMVMHDKQLFDPDKCHTFTKLLMQEYKYYKRGLTSNNDLIHLLHKVTGIKIVKQK